MKKIFNSIITVVFALITTIFIWHEFLVSGNNILFVFIFLGCCFLIHNILLKAKKRKVIVSLIIAIIFAIIEILCKSININFTLDSVFDKWFIINFLGYLIIFWTSIAGLFTLFENSKLNTDDLKVFEKKIFKNNIIVFIICFILIFLSWMPYFLRYYPGIVTSDSYSQIEQTIGIIPLSNHHPILHTAIIGIFTNLAKLFSDNINTGIALYSVFQMLIMSALASTVIYFLRKIKAPLVLRIITLLFYMVYPINAIYSITMWKDILFSGVFPIFIIHCYYLIFDTEKYLSKIKNIVLYVIIALLTIYLRHNGLYVVLFTIPFIFICLRKYWKKTLPMFISIIVIYFIINTLIYNVLKVSKGSVVEMLSIPTQAIARCEKYHREELDEETRKEINNFFIVENIGDKYNPILSDDVKWSMNVDYYSNNKGEFISLWIKLFKKYPKDYIEAFISNSYGYYYPETKNSAVFTITQDHNMGIEQTPKIEGQLVDILINTTESRNIPVICMIYSIGLGVWLTLICLGYKIYAKEYKFLLIYLPIFVLWLTLIASPAFCEFRYAYPIFTMLPIYIAFNFKRKEE